MTESSNHTEDRQPELKDGLSNFQAACITLVVIVALVAFIALPTYLAACLIGGCS